MKKRLSFIVGLCLCATIFSVYAAWVYADQAIAPVTQDGINITIEDATQSIKGTLNVNSSSLAIALGDDESTAAYDIVETFTGSAVISFTAEDATVPVDPDTLTLKCVVSVEGQDPVYEIVNGGVVEMSYDSATDKWTISAEALNAALNLKEYDISTYAKYVAYKSRVAATALKLTISEATI